MNKTFKKALSLVIAVFMMLSCAVFSSAEEAVGSFKYGDINADGSINSSDALAALRHAVGAEILEGDAFKAADVNGDANINSSDALLVLQYSVGTIKLFPVETKVPMPKTKAEILALYSETIKAARAEIPAYKLNLTNQALKVDLKGSMVSMMSKEEIEAQKQSMMKKSEYQNLLRADSASALANLPGECKVTDPAKFQDITCKQLADGNYQIDIIFKNEKDPKAGSPIVTMLKLPDKATFVKTMQEEVETTMGGANIPVSAEVGYMEYQNCSISCVISARTGELVSMTTTSDMVSSVTMYVLFYSMTTDTTARTTLAYSNFIY